MSLLPENKKITINYRFHEILKIQPFNYSKNDISGYSHEIYISEVWLTTFQPDPQGNTSNTTYHWGEWSGELRHYIQN